ncbi:restriction endonuclease subunit S [Sphingobacteriales bacterium UPWRP_1]|nr:restriction endonuclease subunit S [Sphingobacteriales bacterium UPWRP_1]
MTGKFEELNLPYEIDLVHYETIKEPALTAHIDRVGIEFYSRWKEVKLKDITSKIGSGATPTGGGSSYKTQGISLIRSQNVLDFLFSYDGLAFIDEEQANELKNVTVKENDVLLNITGDSVARVCKVPNDVLPARVNQHVSIIRADESKSNSDFLLYYLQSIKEYLLIFSEIGGTRNALTKGMIEDLKIFLPPLPEQQAIAEILSSIDDKIDLLHRQNNTLEQLAETLFRQWFVEEAEESWEVKKISEIIEVRDGTHDSPKQKETGKYLITSKHLKPTGIDFESAYKISEQDFNEVNKRSKVDKDDILFSMIGTLGLIHFVTDEPNYAIKNIGLFKSSQKPEFARFLYLLIKSPIGEKFIYESATGSTQEYITLGSLRSFEFNYPGENRIKQFDLEVEPMFQKIKSNSQQIRTLTQLRDTLLPKLMSGEVSVESEKLQVRN